MTRAANLAEAAGSGFAFRNRIINGDMRIAQASGGASSAYGGVYPVDRFRPDASFNNSWTIQKNAGGVTPPSGFTDYVGFTNGTAYTVGSTDNLLLSHAIEGFNIADFGWGTASAKTITLSFWVRSSITGQHGGVVANNNGRTYPFSYTIPSANTWAYITITVPGDTSGTWATNNAMGLRIYFGLAEGSSNVAAAGSWYAGTYYGASGSVSLAATAGATWCITGVQLEKGTVATPFEFRPYGTELALCQRYYWEPVNSSQGHPIASLVYGDATYSTVSFKNPVTMRTSPSVSFSGMTGGDFFTTMNDGNYGNYGSIVSRLSSPDYFACRLSWGGGTFTGSGNLYGQTGRKIMVSAEL